MTVLCATDFSENSQGALRLAADLARGTGRSLLVTHAVDLAAGDQGWRVLVEAPDEIEASVREEAQQRLESFFDESVDASRRPGLVRFEVCMGSPAEAILDLASKEATSMVVVGTRGASRLREIFLGSVANSLVRQSEVPVVLAPPETASGTFKTIVVGLDLSPVSGPVLRRAATLAREQDGRIHVVHALIVPEVTGLAMSLNEPASRLSELRAERHAQLRQLVSDEGAQDVVDEVHVMVEAPDRAVVSHAATINADLIAMGTRGRRGWSRFFLGNSAERTMRRAGCPVFVVPIGHED
ncbi:hypothetical protein DL240_00560 [Lujinxingia litoralis]|uniref:UspA domain-containing protein n=1 Tax=Lujinxingia litoralis TaxID=2211119 RepID=A0A328C8H9_9DELT|nr:universal stress protein [Lujinxingia litoralis]RAL24735.1 hypothetical protein DL240_00560 [Lujinxingia litoralis]